MTVEGEANAALPLEFQTAETRGRVLAARFARGMHRQGPSEDRGRRECRAHAAPAVSCARVCKKAHTSIQVQRRHSGIPCATVLRLMAGSPRCPGFLATVAPRETSRGKLDPSVGRSGPHAFAVRAGLARPAKPTRPSHPAPTFVTTRTPLWIRAGRREMCS